MTSPDFSDHPIALVTGWVREVGHGWKAHFSRYTYVPQTVEDCRTPFTVQLDEVTPSWLAAQLDVLGDDQELAMHSIVSHGRRVMHIPMVDFASKSLNSRQALEWAHKHLGIDLQLFDSGRAYHAYGLSPVMKSKWVRLMGLLLLANLPGKTPIVDSRWVGHRLIAGYSALRWSRNTSQYLTLPIRVF
jgi:hypothetical protein